MALEIVNPKELKLVDSEGGELKHAYHSLEMASPTKICLHWDDFQNNLTSTFKELRQDTDFADVTLVCEDGTKVDAHRLILAWSSPILMDIMRATCSQSSSTSKQDIPSSASRFHANNVEKLLTPGMNCCSIFPNVTMLQKNKDVVK